MVEIFESIKKDFELLLSTRSRQQKKPLKKIEKLSKTKITNLDFEKVIKDKPLGKKGIFY